MKTPKIKAALPLSPLRTASTATEDGRSGGARRNFGACRRVEFTLFRRPLLSQTPLLVKRLYTSHENHPSFGPGSQQFCRARC
jgi:hypothetical protein